MPRGPVLILPAVLVLCLLGFTNPLPQQGPATQATPETEAQALEKSGDLHFQQGDYALALVDYRKAIKADRKNPRLLVKAGDAALQLTRDDPYIVGLDRKMWMSALQVEPAYLPALERLQQINIEAVEFDHSAEAFKALGEISERIHQIDPTHAKANAYRHIAVVGGWVYGVKTPDDQMRVELDALEAILKDDASNADVADYVARAYVRMGQEQEKTGGADFQSKARPFYDKAMAIFDGAIAREPKNAPLFYRYFKVLLAIGKASLADKAQTTAHLRDLLEKARSLAAPGDAEFADIYISSADLEERQGDVKKAEQILRDLYKQAPDDQKARLFLALLLKRKPETQAEAIAILSLPIVNKDIISGPYAVESRLRLQEQTLLELDTLLIDVYVNEQNPARKQELHRQIQANFEKLNERWGSQPAVLKLRGKIELLEGTTEGAIKAIETFEKCRDMVAKEHPELKDRDVELNYMLARAYAYTHQTGEAKTLLKKVIEFVPKMVEARTMLVGLLLDDDQLDEAETQLDALLTLAPNNPEVIRLVGVAYSKARGAGNPSNVKLLTRLPETTRDERMQKAQIALMLASDEEARRLLEAVLADQPADAQGVQLLLQCYTKLNQKDKALAMLAKAISHDSDNNDFKLWQAQLGGAKPEEIEKIAFAGFDKISNTAERELKYFDYCLAHQRQDEAMAHLEAAEKAEPDNSRVMDIRFQMAVASEWWDQAQEYARRLGEKNFDQAKGAIYRFRLAMAEKKFELAMEIAQEMTQTLPEFARSWLLLGEAQQATQEYEHAISSYRIALDRQSGNFDAIKGIIECEDALGNREDELRYIQYGLKTNPANGYLHEQEIQWALKYGDLKQVGDAVEKRLQARDADPAVQSAWIQLGQAYYRQAEVAMTMKQVDDAQAALDKAHETFGQAVLKWPDDKAAYGWLAQLAVFSNDFANGEKALQILAGRDAFKDKPDAYLMLADYYQRFGRLDLTEAALKNAKDKSNNAPELQKKLSSFYSQQGRFDDALGALDSSSKDVSVLEQIVETYTMARRFSEAEATAQKFLKAHPHDAQIEAVLGVILMNMARMEEAAQFLELALKDSPKNATALYYRGIWHLRQRPPDPDAAVADLLMAREAAPERIDVRLALAQAYQQKHDLEGAAQELEHLEQMAPANKAARLELVQVYSQFSPPRWNDAERLLDEAQSKTEWRGDPDWPRAEAQIYLKAGEADKAIESIRKAMSLAKEDATLTTLTQNYLDILKDAKRYEELKTACDALAQDPKTAKATWVYLYRGNAKRFLGDKPAALADFDTAFDLAMAGKDLDEATTILETIDDQISLNAALEHIQSKVDNGDNHWRIVAAYLLLKDQQSSKAAGLIEKVLAEREKLSPRELDTAFEVAGSVYMDTQMYEKAKVVYAQLLAKSPDDIIALNNLAMALVEHTTPPQPADALRYSQRALDVMKATGINDASLMDTHGWILVQSGRLDDGIAMLRASVELKPMAETRYHLGEAYLRKGLPADAVGQFEEALKMVEKSKAAHERVEEGLEEKIKAGLGKARGATSGP